MQETSPADARAFVMKLARGLHAHGYPAHRLESALVAVSQQLGLEAQFFSAPTSLIASFGTGDDERTFQARVAPGDVDLGRLAEYDAVAQEVARGELAPAAAAARLDAIAEEPPRYSPTARLLAFGAASAAAARFFGGGTAEIAASGLMGLAIGLAEAGLGRSAAGRQMFQPLAAAIAAFLAALVGRFTGGVSGSILTLAGLIVLVPGFPFTVALIELATQHLVSGTVRLAGAATAFLGLGFGVAVGAALGGRVFGPPLPHGAVHAPPPWTMALAVVVAALGFTVLLRAERRDAPWIVASGLVAFSGARLGAALLGPELGAFLGALVAGLYGNVYNRAVRRPAMVALVPGILLLVPGSLGFASVSSLIGDETLVGIQTAFRMTLVAVSLATGVVASNALVPPRLLHAARPSGPAPREDRRELL